MPPMWVQMVEQFNLTLNCVSSWSVLYICIGNKASPSVGVYFALLVLKRWRKRSFRIRSLLAPSVEVWSSPASYSLGSLFQNGSKNSTKKTWPSVISSLSWELVWKLLLLQGWSTVCPRPHHDCWWESWAHMTWLFSQQSNVYMD